MATTPTSVPAAPAQPQAPPADPQSQGFFDSPESQGPATPPEPASEWFLEAPTGSRYRSADDAVRGIAEKDATISRLQQQLQQVQSAFGQPQPQAPAGPNYLQIMERALTEQNPALFQDVVINDIRKEARNIVREAMENLNPLITHAGLNHAVEIASTGPNGDPNIPNFVRSEGFRQLTKKWDVLGNAIQAGAADPKFATTQLPQILQMAYALSQVGAAAPAAPNQPQQRTPSATTVPAQPTTSPAQSRQELYKRFSEITPTEWAEAQGNQKF